MPRVLLFLAPRPLATCVPLLPRIVSRVLRIHRRVARGVSVAHERPEIDPVIAGNFTQALPEE
jgi:hypothetical protein